LAAPRLQGVSLAAGIGVPISCALMGGCVAGGATVWRALYRLQWARPYEDRARAVTLRYAWEALHNQGWYATPERVAGGVALGFVVIILMVAWVQLVRVYRTGRLQSVWADVLRAALPSSVVLTVVVVTVSALSVCTEHQRAIYHRVRYHVRPLVADDLLMGVAMGVVAPLGLLLVLGVSGRMADALGELAPGPAFDPTCIRCGYNLTGLAPGSGCPECGAAVAISLSREARAAPAWERSPCHPLAWVRTCWQVLFHPRRFYRRMLTRASARTPFRFALLVTLVIWSGTWVCALTVVEIPELWVLMLAVVWLHWFVVGLVLLHRLLGAAVVGVFVLAKAISDGRSAARVVAYESAYLLVIWAWCVASAFAPVTLRGVQEISGLAPWWRVIATPRVFYFGLVVLGLLWLRRWAVALRCVRWANF